MEPEEVEPDEEEPEEVEPEEAEVVPASSKRASRGKRTPKDRECGNGWDVDIFRRKRDVDGIR